MNSKTGKRKPMKLSMQKAAAISKPEKKKHIELVKPVKPVEQKPAPKTIAERIANELHEDKLWPRRQIVFIVNALGDEQALLILQQAQAIEMSGGQFIKSGKRRRTIGGVWFNLCYSFGQPLEGKTLVRPNWQPPKARKKPTEQTENTKKPAI